MRRLVVFLAVTSLLAGIFGVIAPAARAGSSVGSFEIDGNLIDSPAGEPIDWSTPPPNLTNFADASGSADDGFGGGSKNNQPATWSCTASSSPNKVDIKSGQISFRKLPTGPNGTLEQYVYVNYTRAENNGDSHMDYEFNQSSVGNPNCPQLPARSNGDIVLTFDTERGGARIIVGAYKWIGNATSGSFQSLSVGSQGTTWDGAVNIPNSIPDHIPGDFGEAALNLTRTIGEVACGQFASAYMKTRSSTSINSQLQDRTSKQPVSVGECPNSNLAKAVRNVTANGTFGTTATASPGNVLEYRLTYSNDGNVTATGVVVTDVIQAKQTLVPGSCTPACTGTGTTADPLRWSLGSVAAGDTRVMTFRVTLDSGGWSIGANTVKNVAVVDSDTETPENSNETTTTVNASVTITSAKSVNPTSANVGQTVHYTITLTNSGNQPGTTSVTDDYDQAHLTISNITGGGVDNGNTITWTNVTVVPGTPMVLEYDALIKGPFSGGAGTGGCAPNQFPVVNQVTLSNGAGTSATLCVNGQAVITAVKTVNPTTANEGDTVTYTIQLSNSGNIPGTITILDDYDEAHLTIGTISDGGQNNQPTAGKIQWTNIVVPVGTNTETLTYSATVKVGSFSGTPGGNGCGPTQFPVINMVTLSSGGGDNETLCVNGHANITVSKSVSPTSANVGDTVTYTITLTNTGNIAGATTVVDDYDQAHLQVSNITGGGVDNGNTITWTNVNVPVGTTTLTYKAKIIGTFSGSPGPDCQIGQFPVVNHVTVTGGGSDDNTLCVNASPDLHVVKSADKTQITSGGTITYTLTYSNTGAAEATNVVITETVPAGTSFVSCTGGCDSTNLPTVIWNIGTVAAGGGGSVTMTVTVTSLTACQICNVATIASTEKPAGVSSNQLCVGNTPTPNPAGAHASGNATGANVFSSLLGLDLTVPVGNDEAPDHTSVDSAQGSVGSNSEQKQFLTAIDVPQPAPGSILHADILRSVSTGTVTALPARAAATSVGSAANVNILNGLVTATLVRGVANAEATGTSVNVNSLGSAIEGLRVLGVPQAVFPGARVDLPAAVFGVGSYVAIYEEVKNTSTPSGTSGGTYNGDITVNMIRVHVTNMLVAGQVEVVVGHATAHADFPQTTLCGPQANQSVSGDAFMAQVLTDPSILPILVGGVEIPTSGGQAANSVNQIVVGQLLTSKAATTSVNGGFTPLNTTSTSSAEVKFLCLLEMTGQCAISARAVRAQANSTATALNRTSDSVGTEFVALKIGAQTISLPVAPNTVINLPGIGFVKLNEQFCDNGATLESNCSNGTVPGHTGITVRAIHVVLLDPAAGGTPGVDVIVAEAHSDARFV